MATTTTKHVTLEEIARRNKEPYDFETKIGVFALRRLSHGEVREINERHFDPETSRVKHWQDFIDDLVVRACETPKFDAETLKGFADDEGVIQAVGLHVARKHGIIAQPAEAAPNAAAAPTSSSS